MFEWLRILCVLIPTVAAAEGETLTIAVLLDGEAQNYAIEDAFLFQMAVAE